MNELWSVHQLLFEALSTFTCSQAHIPLEVIFGMCCLHAFSSVNHCKDGEIQFKKKKKSDTQSDVLNYTEQSCTTTYIIIIQYQFNCCYKGLDAAILWSFILWKVLNSFSYLLTHSEATEMFTNLLPSSCDNLENNFDKEQTYHQYYPTS